MKDFFSGLTPQIDDSSVFISRRKDLLSSIKAQLPDIKDGMVLLFANFELPQDRFRQDKNFFYYTGCNEPGAALVIDFTGKTTLYLPNYFKKRSQWMKISDYLMQADPKSLFVDAIEFLGEECEGYTLNPYFSAQEYCAMIAMIKNSIETKKTIFAILPKKAYEYSSTRSILEHLQQFIPHIMQSIYDISSFVAMARRQKDMSEIEKIYRAIEITELAHESAIQMIKHETLESEVQASLEYMMIASHARPSFPSIVASGKNSTVLHYNENTATLKNGDVVVVDIGAELNNYCADLTRTYPVSGKFSARQKELYQIVLDAQEYVASQAKPGMWLRNQEKLEQSLHHLAIKFLQKHGYDKYFPHGIGHYLGLDVHDVGDYATPLQEGDVITIEPGIYIPQEGIGIRIEDNYWITKDSVICLSENLPKEIDEIEELVQRALRGEDASNESDEDDWMEEDEFDDEEDEDYN